MRAALLLAGLWALGATASSDAHVTAPPGWTVQSDADGTLYMAPSKNAMVLKTVQSAGPSATPASMIETFKQTSALFKNCPLLEQAAVVPILNGRAATVGRPGYGCTLWAGSNGTTAMVLMVMENPNAPAGADAIARKMLAQHLASGPVPQSGARTVATSAVTTNPADLRQALAVVPQAHRPIAYILQPKLTQVGDQQLILTEPWMIFANGYATNCFEWDPAVQSPTPAALAPWTKKNCDVFRWRKVGLEYQLQNADKSWGDAVDGSEFIPFKAGAMFDVAMEAQNSVSVSVQGPGTVAFTRIVVNNLGMTRNGFLDTSSTVKTWNFADSASSVKRNRGMQYFLDGFLIAIKAQDGKMTRNFVGALFNGSQPAFIYLNGTLFSPIDSE
jgi:hypothetical protein